MLVLGSLIAAKLGNMTLVLNLKPQLTEKLHSMANERGVTIEQLLTQDLESRYLLPNNLVFSSLGIGESDLNGADSEDWLFKSWSQLKWRSIQV